MAEGTQIVTNGQSRTNNLSFDFTSWWRPDITNCFTTRQKVCVANGLSYLSALLLTIACLMLLFRRCRVRDRKSGEEAACALYTFLGNVCSTVGAVLSNQLSLQVFMSGFMAAVDAIHLISILLTVWLCWNTRAERIRRTIRQRRRQNLMAVSLLLLIAGGGSYLASSNHLRPVDRPLPGRRLLADLLDDSTEVLGYVLGLLSFVIAWTSKFPTLFSARRTEMSLTTSLFSRLLNSLAGVLYTFAILLHNAQYVFVLKAMPWLLTSVCSAALDLTIVALFWWKKAAIEQETGGRSPDTECLLGCSSPPSHHRPRWERKNKHTMAEMGHYMDVNIQPVRKVCLKEVTLSREAGVPKSHPLRKTVRVVRVDEPFTSETFSDSSSLNSDLEWDFGEANEDWNKMPKEHEKRDEIPLQEWPKNPSLKPTVCSCEPERNGKSIEQSDW
ncbi:hypothetical protein UPYG_G00038530 [Umbra pygmaea]|uniref:Transmembrane protein 44 n=1 Tax=Umbra pygmaea TaxID=75934 RepID=A0ABD0Y877_UMBPY